MIASVFLPVFAEYDSERDGRLLRRSNVEAERRKDVRARDGVFSGALCVESERGEEHQRARQHGLGHATMYWRAHPAVTGNRMGRRQFARGSAPDDRWLESARDRVVESSPQ